MHPDNEEALQTIDAAFFSGDSMHDLETLSRVEMFIGRWTREAVRIRGNALSMKTHLIRIGTFLIFSPVFFTGLICGFVYQMTFVGFRWGMYFHIKILTGEKP